MLNRTGSSWLRDMLNKLPLGYKAGEWFNTNNKWLPFDRESVDTHDHLRQLSESQAGDESRVLVKCNISQVRLFQEAVLADSAEHRYVLLIRQDLLGQALSQFLLMTRLEGKTPGIGCLEPAKVTDLVAKYDKANDLWIRWLEEHASGYHRMTYEAMVADPGLELRRVVEYLDGPQVLDQIPADFDYPGARRKNQVPFIGQWREAMRRFAEGDDSWRELLEQEVEGELFLS